ncbi:hypothetical protein D3C87_1295260 [compost metagenome]
MLEQLTRLAHAAQALCFTGAFQQHPIPHIFQGRLPTIAARLPGSLLKVLFGFAQTVELLVHHAHAAEGVDVIGFLLQARLKFFFSRAFVTGIERLQAAGHMGVLLPGGGFFGRDIGLVHPRPNVVIVRVDFEELFEQRLLCGCRRVDPGQCQAPAFIRIAPDIGAGRQFGQGTNTFGTTVFTAHQLFGEKQRHVRVAGFFPDQPLKTTTGLGPAGIGIRQVVVVLTREQALRLAPTQHLAVLHGGAFVVTGIDQAAGFLKLFLAHGRGHGDLLLQPIGLRRGRLQRLEPGEIRLGLIGLFLLDSNHAKAKQRIGLIGRKTQQLLPDLGGPLRVLARLPIVALFNQQCLWIGGLGRSGGTDQRSQDCDG